jgi:hypothetical protein
MTTQHDSEARRLSNKMWAQALLVAAAIVILIVLAANYVW